MHNFKIISDSSCDLPSEYIKKFDINLAAYSVTFDSIHYSKENIDITPQEFYNQIMNNAQFPKTSLPSITDYIDTAEPYLKQGQAVLCFCLSSKFSGSYQSALNARNILKETYPNSKMEVIDSMSATGGQGLLVYEAARMRESGLSFEEAIAKINKQRLTSKISFTLDSLDYLQKGGRIGKASALAGTILNIKPLIVLENGELIPHSKVRGQKKALRAIIEKTASEILSSKSEYLLCIVKAHRDDKDQLADPLTTEYGFNILEPPFDIGVTISAHTGHTAIGICYIKKFEFI